MYKKRIVVLYSELAGYTAACLKALKNDYDVEMLVFRWPVVSEAPFDERHVFGWIDQLYEKQNLKADEILEIVSAFEPDAVFMSGWIDPDYLKVARVMKRRNIPVVAGSDTQWTGSWRQRIGKFLAPWYLHSAIDVLWVAGERQRQFARQLGFRGDRCWAGYYACDWDKFAKVYSHGRAAINPGMMQNATLQGTGIHDDVYTVEEHAPFFLYVGRYSEEKGLRDLVNAYIKYRLTVSGPWKLVCAGAGPLEGLLDGIPGIENRGFMQPDKIPALMAAARAFVLPSRQEPWGVVVQEAAASGLPLFCSSACGAAIHLLQDRYNGFLFESGDAPYLADCLVQFHEMTPGDRQEMGLRSHQLSRQFTPERWARTFMEGVSRLKERISEYDFISIS